METSKLYGLDHLRALAITLVFFVHYTGIFSHPAWLQQPCSFGWAGVDLFFVLSGYLIATQLFRDVRAGDVSLCTFYIKRFFRIVPAYLVVVALYFCFPQLRERSVPASLWRYLTFTQNFGLDLSRTGAFSHSWSLCIEEQFYLLLPLCLAALLVLHKLRAGIWIILALFVGGVIVRWSSYCSIIVPVLGQESAPVLWYKWIYYPTWCRLDGLLAGVLLAAGTGFAPKLKYIASRHGNALLIVGLAMLAIAWFLCANQMSFGASVFGFPLVALGFAALVASAVTPGSLLFCRYSSITATVANLSYSLYLTHKMVIHVTQQYVGALGIPGDSIAMLLVCMATCLGVAVMLRFLIERPFMRLRNRILARHG